MLILVVRILILLAIILFMGSISPYDDIAIGYQLLIAVGVSYLADTFLFTPLGLTYDN